jgi:hypothetical protein
MPCCHDQTLAIALPTSHCWSRSGVTHWRCVQADLWEAARAVRDGAFLVRKHVAAAATRALHHVTFCRAAGTHSSVTLSLEQLLLLHGADDMLFCILLLPRLHTSANTLLVGHVSLKWPNAACGCCQLAGSPESGVPGGHLEQQRWPKPPQACCKAVLLCWLAAVLLMQHTAATMSSASGAERRFITGVLQAHGEAGTRR